MGTVADLIRGAFRVLGTLASSEAPTAAEQADALDTLNDMLDSWAGERLVLFGSARSIHVITPGITPHTMGTGGTINTTRPVRIERASIQPQTEPGAELPLTLLSDDDWQGLQGKESEGRPTSLWIEAAYPLLKLHFHPVPTVADVLVLYTWQQLGRFASSASTVDMPPGYTRAIKYNLARELAPEFGAMSQEALAIADEAKATLKRLNHKPRYLTSDPAVLGGGAGGGSIGMGSAAGGGGTDSGGLY